MVSDETEAEDDNEPREISGIEAKLAGSLADIQRKGTKTLTIFGSGE